MRTASVLLFTLTMLPAAAGAEEEKAPPVIAPLTVTPYGFVILTSAYNTGTVNSLEAPTSAASGSGVTHDDIEGLPTDGSTILTPRQTRLGMKMNAGLSETMSVSGVAEIDWWGLHGSTGAGAITQTAPRLRLAYFTLGTKTLQITAGQNWSILNNPFPTSMGHIVIPAFTAGGNLWNRLPQLTLTYKHDIGLVLKVSAVRPHSGKTAGAGAITQVDETDPGSLSGMPFAQARAAYESSLVSVGVAGHFGQEKHAIVNDQGEPDDVTVPTQAVAADIKVSFAGLTLYVEAFTGANMTPMFSLAGVQVFKRADDSVEDVEEVKSRGGWAQVSYEVMPKELSVNVAAGVEEIIDRKQVAAGGITENNGVFANVIYAPYKHIDVGLEYSRNNTYYKAKAEGVNNQVNLGFRFTF